jgi:hypothetical protein
MTATVETAPEETSTATESPAEETKAVGGDKHRHRTVRHVAVHGGSAGAVSVAAEVLHVFGPSALGLGMAGVAAAGAGVVAVRKRGKSSRGSRKSSLARTMRRTVKTAGGTRTAAGLRRSKGAAGTSGRTPHTASRRTAAAGLRGGASRRAAGAAPGARRTGAASGRSGRGGGMLHRRTRKPSIAGGRAKPRGSTGRAAGSSRRTGGAGADPRSARLGNKVMRRLTRASRTRQAAATRPAGKHAAPVTRAGRIRKQASIRGRHATRLGRRSAARSWRFAKAGAKASRPFLRLRPPKNQPGKPAMRTAAKPATAKKPNTATANKPKAKTAKTAPAIKKTAKKTPTQPGRTITAPGLTVKDIMDTNAPSMGITAAADAITEHIAGFEPENALEIGSFLSGLDHLFSTLGSSLITVSEKLGTEHPVDASVVEMLQQMGAHALNLAEYGTTSHSLFRAAHEAEIGRLEQPRANEHEWDVERNR